MLLVFLAEKPSQEDHETLLLTVEALKAQLEEQTRLCKEQVHVGGERYMHTLLDKVYCV